MEGTCTTPPRDSIKSNPSSEPSKLVTPMSSGQPRPRLSERRYTPTESPRSEQEGFRSSILVVDSLEVSKPHSRLIQFMHQRPGDDKPRQIMLPMFFHTKPNRTHKRQASLSIPTEPNTLNQILDNLGNFQKSNLKRENSAGKRKTVSFCSEVDNFAIANRFTSAGHSPEPSMLDSIVFTGAEDPETLMDSLEIEDSKITKRDKGSIGTFTTAPNSFVESSERLSAVILTSSNSLTGKKLEDCSLHLESLKLEEPKSIPTTCAGTLCTQTNAENQDEIPEFFTDREAFEYEQEIKASGI